MFDNASEEYARSQILDMVRAYYDRFHTKSDWEPGQRISYAARVYDSREMENLTDSMLEFWLTAGRYAEKFEKGLAAYLGMKHCLLVNSGSSANLLAFMTLTSPALEDRAIKPGDEVITVAAGFPTTISPIVQYGAVPVFLDVTIPQYNVDISMLECALSSKTKAVMLAHTLGNPFNLKVVKDFCKVNNLWLIEDNCDALGSEYVLDGKTYKTGTIGDIGTSSFYPPHHITMGEGGAIYTNHPLLHRIALSMRDWGRDCVCPSGHDNICGHRFDNQYGELPLGYDHKYVYSHFGYNLKATDMQAAIGCAQLEKLPEFVKRRKENFNRLYDLLTPIADKLVLPKACENSNPSWFGFLMTCKEGINRDRIVQYCEIKGVQTRMLFAGNLVKQPCFDTMREKGQGYRIIGRLENTDRIMKDTFWVGVFPGMSDRMLEYMAEIIQSAV